MIAILEMQHRQKSYVTCTSVHNMYVHNTNKQMKHYYSIMDFSRRNHFPIVLCGKYSIQAGSQARDYTCQTTLQEKGS